MGNKCTLRIFVCLFCGRSDDTVRGMPWAEHDSGARTYVREEAESAAVAELWSTVTSEATNQYSFTIQRANTTYACTQLFSAFACIHKLIYRKTDPVSSVLADEKMFSWPIAPQRMKIFDCIKPLLITSGLWSSKKFF